MTTLAARYLLKQRRTVKPIPQVLAQGRRLESPHPGKNFLPYANLEPAAKVFAIPAGDFHSWV
jgi:hypothetical protein